MPSATYILFRNALRREQPVTCIYESHKRELCPVVLGHSKGEEKVLAFQTGGSSSKGLSPDGDWKCLKLAKVHDAKISTGRWREGKSHNQTQSCVQEVDLDINIHVRHRR